MLTNVADLVNPNSGKTWRQENSEKVHNIPLGTLVEVKGTSYDPGRLRLFVVHHGRDCDQTPLYYLSFNTVEEYQRDRRSLEQAEASTDPQDRMFIPFLKGIEGGQRAGGYSEDSLIVIRLPGESSNG